MADREIDWLAYIDTPDWSRPSGWERYISAELQAAWPTLTYEQKWAIAQTANCVPQSPSRRLVTRIRDVLDEFGGLTPVDRPDAPVPCAYLH